MATISTKFRPSSIEGKEGSVYYQVIHRRNVKIINSGYKLFPEEWSDSHCRVMVPEGDNEPTDREQYLSTISSMVNADRRRLCFIIQQLDREGLEYTSETVVERFVEHHNDGGFISFAQQLLQRLCKTGRNRTADTYSTVLSRFTGFLGGRDVLLADFDDVLAESFESALLKEGVCPNTSSFYMRNLRAIYNRAVDDGLMPQRDPFRRVYTGVMRTRHRAIKSDELARVWKLNLMNRPSHRFARDMFMFSFFTRGMSFVDMAYLRKSDLRDGVLKYRRRKTRQLIIIEWLPEMQAIVDRYDTSATPYLLPIIKGRGRNAQREYLSAAHRVNARLKELGRELDLGLTLTTYVARHSWASIASAQEIPLQTIGEALGHENEKTTRIYVMSLKTSQVDKANRKVIAALKKG